MNVVLDLTSEEIAALMRHYRANASWRTHQTIAATIKTSGATITIYNSGKVVIQGANIDTIASDIKRLLNRAEERDIDYYTESIGSDESGVGDYFGPLTACATYVTPHEKAFLTALSLRDSKAISDAQIMRIAPKIAKRLKHSVLVLDNESYNSLIDKGYNAHKLKAYLHAQCHRHLIKKIGTRPMIVVDAFCAEKHYKRYLEDFENAIFPDTYITKAESHYASVAAASVIARYRFLQQLETLSRPLGEPLLKGASEAVTEQTRRLIETHGEALLNRIAKRHFKTTKKALNKP